MLRTKSLSLTLRSWTDLQTERAGMLGRSVEFVGGPMCGERCKVKYSGVGEVVFIPRIQNALDPQVHVYEARERGDDFAYLGLRPYCPRDAGRIMGHVP